MNSIDFVFRTDDSQADGLQWIYGDPLEILTNAGLAHFRPETQTIVTLSTLAATRLLPKNPFCLFHHECKTHLDTDAT